MNFATIKHFDVANGPGIRLTLFVSGCTIHCPDCFNKAAWDFNYGKEFTENDLEYIIDNLRNPMYQGLTLLGGEPLDNVVGLIPLVKRFREEFGTTKDLWCFTGFTYEAIMTQKMESVPNLSEFLSYIDVLVDGPFEMDKKDMMLVFKGSSNQRTIDMQKTLAEGHIVLL